MPKSVGANTQPCFTPLLTLKASEVEPLQLTVLHVFVERGDFVLVLVHVFQMYNRPPAHHTKYKIHNSSSPL